MILPFYSLRFKTLIIFASSLSLLLHIQPVSHHELWLPLLQGCPLCLLHLPLLLSWLSFMLGLIPQTPLSPLSHSNSSQNLLVEEVLKKPSCDWVSGIPRLLVPRTESQFLSVASRHSHDLAPICLSKLIPCYASSRAFPSTWSELIVHYVPGTVHFSLLLCLCSQLPIATRSKQ